VVMVESRQRTAEEVGGDYGEKERAAEMRERELLRGEREFLSVFSFIFNKVFISLFF
jgi:hypothetical protein